MASETFTALYRKYRPQTFKDVEGQDHIVKVLEGSIKSGNISHAYLFSGGRGTGKTSIARIFARALGCTPNDLYEIDAASNRGIDDIRELRESVGTLPFESPYKVYIIDEVHMLTKEAFNALLKTLEEPPAHALFMLATTETDKLPETVVSRCQTFSFKKPTQKVLKDLVVRVAKKEGYTLEGGTAELVALLGDGSFRDTLGMLQKVVSASTDKKITLEEVEIVTGAPKGSLVHDFISSIHEGNKEKGLTAIQNAAAANIDIKVFLKLVLERIRFILLYKNAPGMQATIADDLSSDDLLFVKTIAEAKETKISAAALAELLGVYGEVGRSAIPELPLELAVIRLTV